MSKRGWGMFGLVAVVALAGCASEDWQSKYEEQQKQNLDLAAQNDDMKQARAEAAAKAEQYAAQLKQTDMQAQRDRQAREDLAKQLEQQRLASAARPEPSANASASANVDMKAMHDLVEQLKRELGKSASDVGVTKDGNIEITVASDVTFATGKSDLTEAGKKSLRGIAPLLKGKFAPYQIRVEGHTDSTPVVKGKPTYQDNFGLGSARSLAVVRYMETELSVEPTRLMSASRGEHDPVADNKSESGKKQNRRVEIVVVIPHDAAISMSK